MGLRIWGWLVLAGALLTSGYVALAVAPERVPLPGLEATRWIATTSLVGDDDLRFEAADTTRYRVRFGSEPRDVRLAKDSRELDSPPISTRVWAAATRISAARGPLLLNWILFTGTLLLAGWALAPTLGQSAPLWIAVLAFASSAFLEVYRYSPDLLALVAVVAACSLVWGKRSFRETKAADIFEGDLPGDRAPRILWRWPLAGLALGAAAVRSPLYLFLALPLLVDLPRARRAGASTLFAAGVFLPVAFVAGAAGLPWERPSSVFAPSLLGWNCLYALVGRSAGVLVWFVPVLAILVLGRRRSGGSDGRAWLPHAVLGALFFQVLLYPFDWAGDRLSAGNPWFVPLYGALWFALDPRAGERGRSLVAALLVVFGALPWLLPYWLHPAALTPAPPAAISRALAPVRGMPLFESTLREIPGSLELRRGGTRLRSLDAAIGPAGGGGDRLSWYGSREATVVVESDRPLAAVRFELGDRAPSTLDVSGGAPGATQFSPGGEVSFEVNLAGAARSHPLWWTPKGSVYFLKLTLPEPPPAPIPFDLGVVRPVAGRESAPASEGAG